LFLGYSTTQNAYKCLDLSTNKLYRSRHVLFDESHSQFQALSPAYSSSNSSFLVAEPLIGVPAPPQPSLVILDRATISASPSGTASTLPFSVEEHVPFNSSCYSPIVVHHSEDLISSPILPLTPAYLSQPTTNVTILAQISPTVSDVATDSQPQRTHSMITRSLNNIYKPKQFHVVTKHPLPHAIEPSYVSQALGDPRW
jgi:histone deacetylase 1/2